jgi:hypothetical protein
MIVNKSGWTLKYMLYYSKRLITQKKLRQSLVESLVYERMSTSGRMQKAQQGRPFSHPHEERLNDEPHFIENKEMGSGACVVCKANKLRKGTI